MLIKTVHYHLTLKAFEYTLSWYPLHLSWQQAVTYPYNRLLLILTTDCYLSWQQVVPKLYVLFQYQRLEEGVQIERDLLCTDIGSGRHYSRLCGLGGCCH